MLPGNLTSRPDSVTALSHSEVPESEYYACRKAVRTEAGNRPRSLTVKPFWRAQARISALLGDCEPAGCPAEDCRARVARDRPDAARFLLAGPAFDFASEFDDLFA